MENSMRAVNAFLTVTDRSASVLLSTALSSVSYGPFGFTPDTRGSKLAYTGELIDSLTQTYLLGNGYRRYNPVLHRFICPDHWSPFGAGGINSYIYCGADPINNSDPTGHARVKLVPPRQIVGASSRRMFSPVTVAEMMGKSPHQLKWANSLKTAKQAKGSNRAKRIHNSTPAYKRTIAQRNTISQLEIETKGYAALDKNLLSSIYRDAGPDTISRTHSNIQHTSINSAFGIKSLLTNDLSTPYKIIKTDGTEALFSGQFTAAYYHYRTNYVMGAGGAYRRQADIAELQQMAYESKYLSTPISTISSYLNESDLKQGIWTVRNS